MKEDLIVHKGVKTISTERLQGVHAPSTNNFQHHDMRKTHSGFPVMVEITMTMTQLKRNV